VRVGGGEEGRDAVALGSRIEGAVNLAAKWMF